MILEIETKASITSLKEILWKYGEKNTPKLSLISKRNIYMHSVPLAGRKHKHHDNIIQYCKLFHVL